jgi:hypothetical protein
MSRERDGSGPIVLLSKRRDDGIMFDRAADRSPYDRGEVVIHDDPNKQRGCSGITLGGSARIWGNDPQSAETFVHESGHMLYALGDEYCCDGG